MNTPSDTDEGRTRPSVWLVYAMSVLVGVHAITWVLLVTRGHVNSAGWCFVVCMGLFGIIAAVGASRLRPWGWWLVVVWFVLHFLFVVSGALRVKTEPSWMGTLAGGVLLALVVWLLTTCRQLFFPPKTEGEE